jgi:formylmethanofuran dehydrogenase subunit D
MSKMKSLIIDVIDDYSRGDSEFKLAEKYDPKGAYIELNPSILEQLSSKSGKDLINNISQDSLNK